MDLRDLVWVTMNLDDENRLAYAGPSRHVACRVACAIVGNNSGADTGEIVLYGPGDGTTSVMVRQLPRACTKPADPTNLRTARRAVAADLHQSEDGYWRCGPWADPATPEGEDGVVQLIRKALN